MKPLIEHITQPYRKLNHRLLIHLPWLWETKWPLALILSLPLSLLAVALALYVPNYIFELPTIIAILSVIALGYWASKAIIYNGDTENVLITRVTYRSQFLVYFACILAFALPTCIVLIIGIDDFLQLDTDEYNVYQSLHFWSFDNTNDIHILALKVITGSMLTAIILQLIKGIGLIKILQALAVYAISWVFIVLCWNISIGFGVMLFGGFAIYIFLAFARVMMGSKKVTNSHFFFSLFAHILTPFICWIFFYGIVLTIMLISDDLNYWAILWSAWIMGTSVYVSTLLPRFNLFYLKYRQQPKKS